LIEIITEQRTKAMTLTAHQNDRYHEEGINSAEPYRAIYTYQWYREA
jgi:hypothetical protein